MSDLIRDKLSSIKSEYTNAYQHLKKLLMNIVQEQKSLDQFQHCSYIAREPGHQQMVYTGRESYADMKQFQASNRILLNKLNTGTAEEPQEPASLNYVPNIMDEAQVFSRLGVGFGQDQSYRIYKSLCNLLLKKNAKQVKFWGKILGKDKDYYIAEGLADGGDDPGELTPDTEPKGVGINKWCYWVTTILTGQWTELPVVTPSQLKTARKIKYIFSGDLKKNILTNPIFSGTEAHLLKCQIVRISSGCSIIPKGLYIANADNPSQIEFAQNYIFPEVQHLALKQNWVYTSQGILKNGRVSHMKQEGMEEQQAEKQLKKMMEGDPLEPRLKAVAMDAQNWMVRVVGLEQLYRGVGKNGKILSSGVVGLKSLVWPGWTTAGWEGRSSSIYVGYGHKQKFEYFPREPEVVMGEGVDREEVVIKE